MPEPHWIKCEANTRPTRVGHFTSVERIIGYKPGTEGSAGVGWLEHVTKHHFFPEIWAISNSAATANENEDDITPR